MSETYKNIELKKINKKLNKIIFKLKEQERIQKKNEELRFLSKLETLNFGILFSFLAIIISISISTKLFYQDYHIIFKIIILLILIFLIMLIILEIRNIYENSIVKRFEFFSWILLIIILVLYFSIFLYLDYTYLQQEYWDISALFFIYLIINCMFCKAYLQIIVNNVFKKKFKILFIEYTREKEEEYEETQKQVEIEKEKVKEIKKGFRTVNIKFRILSKKFKELFKRN